MYFLPVIALLSTVSLTMATIHVVHEKRDGEPTAWIRHERADTNAILPLRIGLKQSNLEHMHKFVDDISNPKSANFGKQHWTEDIYEAFT